PRGVGLWPVVPAATGPWGRWSTGWRAGSWNASRSPAPSSRNGVTIAVRTRPSMAERYSTERPAQSCIELLPPLPLQRREQLQLDRQPEIAQLVGERDRLLLAEPVAVRGPLETKNRRPASCSCRRSAHTRIVGSCAASVCR